MKKAIMVVSAIVLLLAAVACNNPNKSPTDKVGGYHVSKAAVEILNRA